MPYFSGELSEEQLRVMRDALEEAVEQLGLHEDEKAQAELATAILEGFEQGAADRSALLHFAVADFMRRRGN